MITQDRWYEVHQKTKLVFRGLRLVFRAARPYPLLWGILLLIKGILPAGIVYLTKDLVDAVSAAIGEGATWANVSDVFLPGGLMVGAILTQQIAGNILEYVNVVQQERVTDYIKNLIHDKAHNVDYALFEDPEFFDKLEQANNKASSQPLALLNNVGSLVQGAVTFLSIAAILVSYSIWLVPILVGGMLPTLYVLVHYNRRLHAWWRGTTEDRRWAQYFDLVLTSQPSAAEIRVYQLGRFFSESYRRVRKRLREDKIRIMRNQTIAKFVAALLAFALTGGIMLWMGWRAVRGTATLGDLALFYQALNQAQSITKSMLSSAGQIFTNVLFLEHLFDFLEQEMKIKDRPGARSFPQRVRRGIEFRGVRFSYPGTNDYALTDFSLHVPAGKTMAIVGENGAGKSTLIKLLCRFYELQDGEITIDGIPIQDIALGELRSNLGLMMQYPVRYQDTVHGNITMGDEADRISEREIRQAAKSAGSHDFAIQLPRHYDTLLGRMFDNSTELSGGQWQRLALTRAYVRHAQILILDEPTSSMDSWTEHEWYDRFRRVAGEKTAIIVTHRFTTAKQADIICVMDDGKVIEAGTHEQLVALGGHYAESWLNQVSERKTA